MWTFPWLQTLLPHQKNASCESIYVLFFPCIFALKKQFFKQTMKHQLFAACWSETVRLHKAWLVQISNMNVLPLESHLSQAWCIGILVIALVLPEDPHFPIEATFWLFCVSCPSCLHAWDSSCNSLHFSEVEPEVLQVPAHGCCFLENSVIKRRLRTTQGW